MVSFIEKSYIDVDTLFSEEDFKKLKDFLKSYSTSFNLETSLHLCNVSKLLFMEAYEKDTSFKSAIKSIEDFKIIEAKHNLLDYAFKNNIKTEILTNANNEVINTRVTTITPDVKVLKDLYSLYEDRSSSSSPSIVVSFTDS